MPEPMRSLRIAILVLAFAQGCADGDSTADVLLFNGTGTSRNDVRAFERLLEDRGIHYRTADSATLNSLDVAQLRAHRLLLVPGGNFEDMGNHLAPATSANIRAAVHGGLNYFGACAGAFIAGDSPYNGVNLTGVRFRFYAAEAQGIRKAAVPISIPDGPTLDHYWEDGPELSGWGSAIAKYPDGTPAAVQGPVGSGWVILSGIHPEAPDDWRGGMSFATPASIDNAYATRLIDAALAGKSLPQFVD
jgi:hypothetical protein